MNASSLAFGKVISALAFLTLAGCAAPVYVKPGASQQMLARDHARCMSQAGYGTGTASVAQMGAQRQIYDACMAGEGWTRQ